MSKLLPLLLVLLASCSVKIDPSMPAAEAGDLSVILGVSEEINSGYAFIRTNSGTPIKETFDVFLPKVPGEYRILGCEGLESVGSFGDSGDKITVPLKELVPHERWPEQYHCEIQFLAKASGEAGGNPIDIKAFGIVRVLSLKSGYSVLPLDSPYAAWKRKYKGQELTYSTAGRSAVEVKSK